MRALRSLLLLVVSLIGLLAPSTAAFATPSDKFVVEDVDDEFVDTFLTEEYGFTVTHSVAGTVKITFDEEGNPTLQRFRLKHTLTSPTGATLTSVDVGIDKTLSVVQDAEGNTIVTVMASGVLGYHFQIPGQGVVAANAGREIRQITLDAAGNFVDFQVLEDAGLSRDFNEEAVTAICTYLAG